MVNNLYDFWKKDLADVYLEAMKPVMKSDDVNKKTAALNSLYIVLDFALKMLHPTMPYITEELFQRLPHVQASAPDSICIAAFPTELESYQGVETQMHTLLETGKNLRSQLASLGVASNAKPTVAVKTTNAETYRMFIAEKDVL
jgi:valyl-tRNA synthetase